MKLLNWLVILLLGLVFVLFVYNIRNKPVKEGFITEGTSFHDSNVHLTDFEDINSWKFTTYNTNLDRAGKLIYAGAIPNLPNGITTDNNIVLDLCIKETLRQGGDAFQTDRNAQSGSYTVGIYKIYNTLIRYGNGYPTYILIKKVIQKNNIYYGLLYQNIYSNYNNLNSTSGVPEESVRDYATSGYNGNNELVYLIKNSYGSIYKKNNKIITRFYDEAATSGGDLYYNSGDSDEIHETCVSYFKMNVIINKLNSDKSKEYYYKITAYEDIYDVLVIIKTKLENGNTNNKHSSAIQHIGNMLTLFDEGNISNNADRNYRSNYINTMKNMYKRMIMYENFNEYKWKYHDHLRNVLNGVSDSNKQKTFPNNNTKYNGSNFKNTILNIVSSYLGIPDDIINTYLNAATNYHAAFENVARDLYLLDNKDKRKKDDAHFNTYVIGYNNTAYDAEVKYNLSLSKLKEELNKQQTLTNLLNMKIVPIAGYNKELTISSTNTLRLDQSNPGKTTGNWTFKHIGGSNYNITIRGSNNITYCLTRNNIDNQNDPPLLPCDERNEQVWNLAPYPETGNPDKYKYRLRGAGADGPNSEPAATSGKCLSIETTTNVTGPSFNTNKFYYNTCSTENARQQFYVYPADAPDTKFPIDKDCPAAGACPPDGQKLVDQNAQILGPGKKEVDSAAQILGANQKAVDSGAQILGANQKAVDSAAQILGANQVAVNRDASYNCPTCSVCPVGQECPPCICPPDLSGELALANTKMSYLGRYLSRFAGFNDNSGNCLDVTVQNGTNVFTVSGCDPTAHGQYFKLDPIIPNGDFDANNTGFYRLKHGSQLTTCVKVNGNNLETTSTCTGDDTKWETIQNTDHTLLYQIVSTQAKCISVSTIGSATVSNCLPGSTDTNQAVKLTHKNEGDDIGWIQKLKRQFLNLLESASRDNQTDCTNEQNQINTLSTQITSLNSQITELQSKSCSDGASCSQKESTIAQYSTTIGQHISTITGLQSTGTGGGTPPPGTGDTPPPPTGGTPPPVIAKLINDRTIVLSISTINTRILLSPNIIANKVEINSGYRMDISSGPLQDSCASNRYYSTDGTILVGGKNAGKPQTICAVIITSTTTSAFTNYNRHTEPFTNYIDTFSQMKWVKKDRRTFEDELLYPVFGGSPTLNMAPY